MNDCFDSAIAELLFDRFGIVEAFTTPRDELVDSYAEAHRRLSRFRERCQPAANETLLTGAPLEAVYAPKSK